MAGVTQTLRRTLATSSAVNPPLLSPVPATVMVDVRGRRDNRRTLAKAVGPRAHHSKNILHPNSNNFHIRNKRSDLYILSLKKYSSFSGEGEERENNNKIIRVSRNSIVGEGGMGGGNEIRNRNRNGLHLTNRDVDCPSSTGNTRKFDDQDDSTKFLTLPTLLTLARVASIPLFIATFYVNSRLGTTATTSIFVAAAITDWLDGYLARKMRLGTVFGAFLDPVADKLMVAATLVLLCSRPPETGLGDVPWLFPVPAIAIIGREITMSAVREWAASQNTKLLQAVAVNNLGKWKTATQMTALTILVVSRDSSLAGSGPLAASGVALLYISAGLAVWSLVVYMRKIWKVLLR